MPNIRSFALDVDPLRQHRDYRLVLSGQIINSRGAQVPRVALPYQMYVLTHSALSLGALSSVQLVGILLFARAGGAVADAVDRRKLLFVTQTGLCTVSTA